MLAQPIDDAALTDTTACLCLPPVPGIAPLPAHHIAHGDTGGTDPAGENPMFEPPPAPLLDLSTERLEVHDGLIWAGRPVAELSDVELAAATRGQCASPPPEQPTVRNQRNWLKLRVQWPQPRIHVHVRVDEIVLDWFRREGPGFQGRMNAVLRAYVDAQIEAEQRLR